MKKVLIIVAAMLTSLIAVGDTWTDPKSGITWNYSAVADGAVIGGNATRASFQELEGDISLPATLGGKTLIAIGSFSFSFCKKVTSITIPDTVTNIQVGAFQDCIRMKSVNIPCGLTEISYNTFGGCSNLTSIVLPKGILKIGGKAFERCVNLSSIDIPSGVVEIGERAFYDCKSLPRELVIPDSIDKFNDYAFYGCSNLADINFPSKLKYIGIKAFDGCDLRTVAIPDTVPGLGGILDGAFAHNKNLKEVYIPHLNGYGLIEMDGKYVSDIFLGCPRIEKVTVPARAPLFVLFPDSYNRITTATYIDGWQIPDNAFAGCCNLSQCNISNVLAKYVGNNAFSGCKELCSLDEGSLFVWHKCVLWLL